MTDGQGADLGVAIRETISVVHLLFTHSPLEGAVMIHPRIFALLTMAFAMLFATQAAANELLNGGFETDAVLDQEPLPGASDWTIQGTGMGNTASAPLDPVRTGVGSLQVVGGGNFGVPVIHQTYPASPGQLWDLQGYMLTKEALPANATNALLKIVFREGLVDLQIDPAMVVTGQADVPAFPGIVALPRLTSASTVNTWQFAHAAGIAPPGTTEVRLFAIFVDESPGTVYFDDLQALLAGDFDNDLDVDGDDLTVWEGAFGQTAAGDADGDHDTDGADFLLWQRHIELPAATSEVGAVPEPSSALLLAVGLALAGRQWARKLSCR